MKLQDIINEAGDIQAERLRAQKDAKLAAAGSHTKPRNISQERWDSLVRQYGLDAAQAEDLEHERQDRHRDVLQQQGRDQAYIRSLNQLNQNSSGRYTHGQYNDKEAQIAKQERDTGASSVDAYGKPRSIGGKVDTTQSPTAQQAAAQQQQFKQQAAAANAKKNAQIAAADRGESTFPPNPAQVTNMQWARKNGFKSIRDFYADIMTRQASDDPKVAQLADQQEKQYYANVKADRARMAQNQR